MSSPRSSLRLALLVAISLFTASCIDAPKVVQGKVVRHDPTAHRLLLTDERPPGEEIELSTEGAELGAPPEAGDLVRVAYRDQQGLRRALRIANLSRQGEILGKRN